MKKLLGLLVVLLIILALMLGGIGSTSASFSDKEISTANGFTAWVSTLWRQTTQTDFNAGVLSNVDTSSNPGDVRLAAGSAWYNTNWQYRRAITIDRTKVQDVANPSTEYTNFPVLVYATGLSNINANGTDIRFTSSDKTTELPREIESYTSGTLFAWVKVSLTKDSSDSSNDVIYMYYGNTSATEPVANSSFGSQNVWTNNYSAVWHLKENPAGTAPQMKDSTSNARNGTTVGSMPSGASVACKIGNGLQFDGLNDGVNTSSSFAISATFTLEGWAKFSSLPTAWQTIVQGGASANRDLTIYNNGSGTTSVDFFDGTDNYFNTAISTGSWYHIAATFSSSTLTIYWNGLSLGTISKSYSSSSGRASMGYSVGLSNDYVNGYLDEVRISNVARSSAWIHTEYNNQNSPSTFFSRLALKKDYNMSPQVLWPHKYLIQHLPERSGILSPGT